MYELIGFTENLNFVNMLNVQNCAISTGNCVHYMYGLYGFAEDSNIHNCVNSMRNCVFQMYGLSRFGENMKTQNCINSRGKCVPRCMDCQDLHKI